MTSPVSFGALPSRTCRISENLIIGAKQGFADFRQLKNEEYVSRVIDLRNNRPIQKIKEFIFCKILGLDYISAPMQIGDKRPLCADTFEKIHSLVQGNNTGITFVHCNSGVHRSLLAAAFDEFKCGRLKSFDDLTEFLKAGNYYSLNKKVHLGRKVPLTPADIEYRTKNLEYQKQAFWKMLQNG